MVEQESHKLLEVGPIPTRPIVLRSLGKSYDVQFT